MEREAKESDSTASSWIRNKSMGMQNDLGKEKEGGVEVVRKESGLGTSVDEGRGTVCR